MKKREEGKHWLPKILREAGGDVYVRVTRTSSPLFS